MGTEVSLDISVPFLFYFIIMKKYFGFFILFICSFVMFSCSSDDDAPYVKERSKETVIVFFPHTGNLYGYLSNNLADIERAMLKKENNPNVIVYMNYGKNKHNACIYEIRREGDECVHDTLRKYTENPYSTVEDMSNLLSEIKSMTPEATDFKMILGCHGMGWIYADTYNKVSAKYPKKFFADHEEENPITRWIGSNSAKIEMDKFAEALNRSSLHLSLMVFDVCYMANVESLYELRNSADYIVGSSIEIMGKGMPYLEIWDEITAPVTHNSLDAICKKVYTYYNNSDQPYCTLSAIDCSKMDNLAAVVKDINGSFKFAEEQRDNLQMLDGYRPSLFYDMGRYVELQCTDASLFSRYKQAEAECVFSHYHTAMYYTNLSQGAHGTHEIKYSSGLTTSAPSLNELAINDWHRTAWFKATH